MRGAPRLVVGPDREGRRVVVGPDGRVTRAGPRPGASALDCADAKIEAGRVNAHTHLYSGLVPFGVPTPEPPPTCFVEILERLWWRLDRALDAPAVRASARWYVAQALLAGTTSLVDHHESPAFITGSLDPLAEACQALGMRAVLCYGATDRNGGREEGRAGLDECARLAARVDASETLRVAVGLHASFTVSDETCRRAGAMCRDLDTVLHVHLAEDAADVADAKARGHAGPLERLEALDALPPGSLLAHGVHLSLDQVRRADALGAWLIQNPRSNEGNGVGYPSALRASERVAIGTDGYPADMDDEIAALTRLGRAAGDPAEALARRAAAGQALIAERFGAAPEPLTPGALGDLVVRDAQGARHVIVSGRVVVRDRALVGLSCDMEALRRESAAEAERLWTRMRTL